MKVYLNFINKSIIVGCDAIGINARISFKGISDYQFEILGAELYKTYYLRSPDRSDVTVAKYKIHALQSIRSFVETATDKLRERGVSVRPNSANILFNTVYETYYKARHEINDINHLTRATDHYCEYDYPLTK